MIYNSLNRFHPLYAPQDPEGLNARLGAFVKGAPAVAAGAPVALTQQQDPDPVATPDRKTDEATPVGEEEEEEIFPEVGTKVEVKTIKELDETAFDAETKKQAEGLDEKAGEKFKALRAELKAFKQKEFKPDPESIPEFKTLKAEVESLRKAKEENEGLKARLESVMKASDELAVKESPEFIKGVTKPLNDIKGALTTLAESSGMSAVDLMALVAEADPGKQDKALAALENRIPRRTLSRIERMCDDYKEVEQEEARLMADLPKTIATSRKQQQEQAEESRKLATGQFQEAARKSFSDYGHTVPGFTDTAGQLTDTAQAIQAAAVAVNPHSLAPEDLGFMIFASKALPAARKEILRLTKELRSLKGGTQDPIPGKAPTQAKPKGDSEPPPNQSFKERMKAAQSSGGFSFNPSLVG